MATKKLIDYSADELARALLDRVKADLDAVRAATGHKNLLFTPVLCPAWDLVVELFRIGEVPFTYNTPTRYPGETFAAGYADYLRRYAK